MTIERVIDYVLPQEGEAAERQVLRLHISEMNALQHSRWLRLQRETAQWARDALGIVLEDEEQEYPEDVRERLELGYRRAAMLGALKKVEIGTCAPDAEEPDTWHEGKLPPEWDGIDAFIDNMPWQLFDLWLLVASECNPGAFFREPEALQKKRLTGQVYVRSLTKRLTIS